MVKPILYQRVINLDYTTDNESDVGSPIIPTALNHEGLRFIRVKAGGKEAIEPEWQSKNNYKYGEQRIDSFVSKGGNYGVIPVGESVCILDVDDFETLERLDALLPFADTFTVRTGSEDERYHYYFLCPDIDIAKKLPIYDLADNTRHLGELYVPGCRAYVVGAGSTHPSGNKYVVVNNVPLKNITLYQLEKHLLSKVKSTRDIAHKKLNPEQLQKRMPITNYKPSNPLGITLGLKVEDWCYPTGRVEKKGFEIQGSHPHHGSSTGMNFAINTNKNTWHCYRDNVGGGVLEYLAVEAGFISCSDVGSVKIEGELFLKVKEYLRDKGFAKQIDDLDAEYRHREVITGRVVDNETLKSIRIGDSIRYDSRLPKDNLIEIYASTMAQYSDAFVEFQYAAIFSIMSTLMFRNAVCRMSQGKIYTNMWTFLLGASTVSRKTTIVEQAEEFLNNHCASTQLPSSFSPEGFIDALSDTPRAWFFKDEMGSMMASMQKPYMAEMRDLFCDLYSCKSYKRQLRKSQRKSQTTFEVKDPYITQLVATTPSNFRDYSTGLDMTSGWLLRFLFFYPRYQKEMMPFTPMSEELMEEKSKLNKKFATYYTFFRSGKEMDFVLSPDALEYFQQWQLRKEKDLGEIGDEVALSIFGRIVAYAVKLAMIFTACDKRFYVKMVIDSDRMPDGATWTIEDDYMREACRQMDDYFFPTTYKVAKEVDRNETTNIQNKIIGLIERNGSKMQKSAIMRALHVKVKELNEAIEALVASDELEVLTVKPDGIGKVATYYALMGGVE